MKPTHTILLINSSAKTDNSVTRKIGDDTITHLQKQQTFTLIQRDLTDSLPHIDQNWIAANFTSPTDRTEKNKQALTLSDALIDELEQADTIIIGAPMYNFSIPASLKAWVDLVCRVGRTFKYTETGPIGLLKGKKVILALASGGTSFGGDMDFVSGYLKAMLGFVGISDVTIISHNTVELAGQSQADKDQHVQSSIEKLSI